MDAGMIQAIFAGVTLLLLWTGTVLGAGIFVMRLVTNMKDEILRDFNKKHEANAQTVEALKTLVIRHDTWLNPEFNGQGGSRIHRT